jgi:hypothetical protein
MWWRRLVTWWDENQRLRGRTPGRSTTRERLAFGLSHALVILAVVLHFGGHEWAPGWLIFGAIGVWGCVLWVQWRRMGPDRGSR